MRIILSRHKYKSDYDWRFINSAEHRDLRIGIQDLTEVADWLADRQLHLCVENVRHRDVDGSWMATRKCGTLMLQWCCSPIWRLGGMG